MPRTFRVDLEELQDKIQQMAAFEKTVDTSLADLERVVERLHLTWTGRAADAQAESHRRWAEGMRQMNAGLAQIRAAGERAHENYTNAATANSHMWASVR